MSERPCVCCADPALPGRLLCETCKGHALELERVRLSLPPIGRRIGAAVAIALAVLSCSGAKQVPCDAHDQAAQVDLAAELADCTSRIDACSTQACIDPIEAKCNRYADTRCAEPTK